MAGPRSVRIWCREPEEQIDDIGAEIARWFDTQSQQQAGGEGGIGGSDASDTPETPFSEDETPLTWEEAVALLDTIPGVNRKTAENMLAEMGLNMGQFPTDKHLASWAGLAPGNRQSGGKRYSGRTRKGNRTLSSVTVQAAWSAVRTKDTFKSRYHRLAARRGKKRAIVAVAHSILTSAWHILTYRQPYQELGGDYFDQRRKEAKVSYLTRQLEKLTGGAVRIELQVTTI